MTYYIVVEADMSRQPSGIGVGDHNVALGAQNLDLVRPEFKS